VNTSSAPTSVVIASANNGGGERNTDFSIAMPFTGAISFDWSFTTSDGPFWDPFLVGIDGVYTRLTTNGGPNSQTGSYSVSVLAGQVFTLRANSVDSVFGRSETTVSNFMAVPEPTSMAIFGLGTLGMAYRSRRKSKA
jgi:PEP-CTERM motif